MRAQKASLATAVDFLMFILLRTIIAVSPSGLVRNGTCACELLDPLFDRHHFQIPGKIFVGPRSSSLGFSPLFQVVTTDRPEVTCEIHFWSRVNGKAT